MNKFEEYIKKYEEIHSGKSKFVSVYNGEIQKVYNDECMFGDGVEFVKKVFPFITNLIEQKQRAVTILDYGCGQALHTYNSNYKYHKNIPKLVGNTIFSFFNGMIQSYYCYDPAVKKYSVKPSSGTLFDLVVLADVLEHIPEEYVVDVIKEAASYCKKDGYIMFTISGNIAYSHFPNEDGSPGENAHITRKSQDWWFDTIANSVGDLTFVMMYTNNDIFKETNNEVNCRTIIRNTPNFTIPPGLQYKRVTK